MIQMKHTIRFFKILWAFMSGAQICPPPEPTIQQLPATWQDSLNQLAELN
jgi:hypothetical protein